MRILAILCLLFPLALSLPGQAQTDQAEQPLVVFVEEPGLQMASVTDSGPDGLTRLAEIFTQLGARTTWLRLRDPLPAETAVVVLVRPRRVLSADYLARLWQIVGAGGSLLLALEPQGYLGTSTELPNRGLDRLISLDAGVGVFNGILMEPWFTNGSFNELYGTFSYGFVDPAANAITEPLLRFDLPVALWGARPIMVDPLGVNTRAWPLVGALPQYVETATDIFPKDGESGQPYEVNLDTDRQGLVSVVGIGENQVVGERVALLGDSEIVQNGYGLALSADTRAPIYPSDYVLTQRLAAWLLRLPEDQYPTLPPGITWIALDGSSGDWPDGIPIMQDDPADTSILSLNIQQARAIRNNSYLYVSVETVAQASPDARIDLELDTLGTGRADTVVSARPGLVLAQQGSETALQITDADVGIGEGIELRIPLRVTGPSPRIVALCLSSARELAFPQAPDCMAATVEIAGINEDDPAPLRVTGAPVIALKGDGRNRINLRTAPDEDANVITSVTYGTLFAAVGISADGEWIKLENAVYSGWAARAVLFSPGNFASLPVLQ